MASTDSLSIPENGNSLTVDWIQRALSAGGDLPSIRNIAVEDIGAGSGTIGAILRCGLTYHHDVPDMPKSVVIKLSSDDKKSLRIAKLLSMYKREYFCFRQLAQSIPMRLPELLYGDFDSRTHRFVMVLEDLGHMEHMDQIIGASAERAMHAIRSVAALHGRFWNRLDQPPASDFLASVGGPRPWLSQLIYLGCLPPCLERFGNLLSVRMQRLAEAFGPRVVDHMRELGAGPQTLTHGDFRLENMFFGDGRPDDFAVIDWQTSGLIGNGVYDVAYFMVSSVPTEVRRRIERQALEAYHGIVCSMGAKGFTSEDCWQSYRSNILGMLVPSVCAGGALDMSNKRIRTLGETMLKRTTAAIEDLDAAELLPTRSGSLTPTYLFSALSSQLHSAYKLSYRLRRARARAQSRSA
ncbi:MAG: phosphotransferase [Caldilineaceae bacterium SB0670_bin_27]|uniref:Phosphotransferase n=1 Tax=Caldilineaceae bacterium SB0664_bin_27 TaxID=2605260 RepID=A0A6B0YT98_9CHLR|nr:phosphotransferase [Caldilineaceae bacterium SB0664_bin_27]MYJ79629.1 phosphotransferase [Caldilineaceae bacterium SB0670_bin_27]